MLITMSINKKTENDLIVTVNCHCVFGRVVVTVIITLLVVSSVVLSDIQHS